MKIAADLGYEVIEKQITRDELYTADELFFSGTAVEITPIKSVDKIDVGSGSRGEITTKFNQLTLMLLEVKLINIQIKLSRV